MAEKEKEGKLRSLTIEVVSNGFLLREDHEPPPSKGNGVMPWKPPETEVFTDGGKLLAAVKDCLKLTETKPTAPKRQNLANLKRAAKEY